MKCKSSPTIRHHARGSGQQRRIVLSINRFERKKNIELALHAFVLVKARLPKERLQLVLAGRRSVRV